MLVLGESMKFGSVVTGVLWLLESDVRQRSKLPGSEQSGSMSDRHATWIWRASMLKRQPEQTAKK